MSFPSVVYGSYGDEKTAQSTKINNLPLGTRMVLPDGREFVHAKASATALIAGDMYQQNSMAVVAGTSDAGILTNMAVATSAAIGATTVVITMAATAHFSKDLLAGGYLFTNDATGEGHCYKIKGNTAAASLGSCTITLEPNDAIKVALAAGTSEVAVRQLPFDNVTITTADTVGVGALAGVAPVAVTASYYCWLQRKGPAAVLTDGTVIVGVPCVVSPALAGAIAPFSTSAADTAGVRAAKGIDTVGYVMNVSASTEYSLVNLCLP